MKTTVIDGVEYKLKRIFECDFCGKKAEAGSEELLTEWRKRVVREHGPSGVHIWQTNACGNCAWKVE